MDSKFLCFDTGVYRVKPKDFFFPLLCLFRKSYTEVTHRGIWVNIIITEFNVLLWGYLHQKQANNEKKSEAKREK